MHLRSLLPLLCFVTLQSMWSANTTLTIDADKPGIQISPTLYGIFFEEINRAGDGGLYAEMLQNRSFEDADVPVGWTLIKDGGAEASITLDKTQPLNANNPTSLRFDITKEGQRVGVANDGFKGAPEVPRAKTQEWMPKFEKAAQESDNGIAVKEGKDYLLSLYARADQDFNGALTVSIEKQDGTALASESVQGIGKDWKKFECHLSAKAAEKNARLVISANKAGTIWLDMVSLFPKDTFKGRSNGMREDLAQFVADMHPAFMRFPGGCFVEGEEIGDAFRWKKTIGDITERPGHWNLWGYRSTDGLGYFEYLQFCEDIGAEPLFVINVGMSHHAGKLNAYAVPMDQMDQYVQDALDAIEYANGPADSKWGSLRAKAGHPEPFHLKYMEIGNENGGPSYDERYALFYDAIKKRYPEVHLVANVWQGKPHSRPAEILDEHYYNTAEFFEGQTMRYDKYDRKGPKVYVGEYAVTKDCGLGNLRAAIGEAAFMTSLERNSDVVAMASYAPLLVLPEWKKWNPNAIVFDNSRIYGTPSYYVQAMFAANKGDVLLPVNVQSPPVPYESKGGRFGVGTWSTQAEFKDIKVTDANGKVLFESDPEKGLEGWRKVKGTWEVADGALRQTGMETDARITAGDRSWKDYTISLKARKLGGKEGFLISFELQGDRDQTFWNIGGWNNTGHGLECPGLQDVVVPGSVEANRWYDIRIEINGPRLRCYLDDKLIHDVSREVPHSMFAVAGRKGDEVIVKVVNAAAQAQDTDITLNGVSRVAADAKALVLTSTNIEDENSFDAPEKVAPKEEHIGNAGPSFQHTFPANSVTVLRLKNEK